MLHEQAGGPEFGSQHPHFKTKPEGEEKQKTGMATCASVTPELWEGRDRRLAGAWWLQPSSRFLLDILSQKNKVRVIEKSISLCPPLASTLVHTNIDKSYWCIHTLINTGTCVYT